MSEYGCKHAVLQLKRAILSNPIEKRSRNAFRTVAYHQQIGLLNLWSEENRRMNEKRRDNDDKIPDDAVSSTYYTEYKAPTSTDHSESTGSLSATTSTASSISSVCLVCGEQAKAKKPRIGQTARQIKRLSVARRKYRLKRSEKGARMRKIELP